MRILMFTWEFPPLISGGLGMACYGMVRALLKKGTEVLLVLPSKETVFFHLKKIQDVDTLPVFNIAESDDSTYSVSSRKKLVKRGKIFDTVEEKLNFYGITSRPESYLSPSEIIHFQDTIKSLKQSFSVYDEIQYEEKLAEILTVNLMGEEDLFKKVQELTIRARKYASLLDFDLIHAHDWLTYPSGIIAKKISGKPLVTHMHATEFDRAGGPGDERIHKIEFAGLSYSDIVINVSKYTYNMVMNRYRIDPAKMRVVHNAYTAEDREDNLPKRIFKNPTILFLGRITIQKGPDYFLDVAKKVIEVCPRAKFIMAGSGDMARKLLHKSASYRLGSSFLFAGFLNRKEVETILHSTDIYMLPSVSEPFGIAPLEAMAYGITAVISKQSGVSEVVENAYKVDFWDINKMSDIIIELIKNPDKRKDLGNKGMFEVKQIQWDTVASKLIDTYQDAINNLKHY